MTKLLWITVCRCFVLGTFFTGAEPILAQDQAQASRSPNALSVHFGGRDSQEDNIKCGFSTIAAAWNAKDSLNNEMKGQLARVLQRRSLQKSVLVGFFRVHYDTTGVDAPSLLDSLKNPIAGTYDAYADSVGAIANYVRSFETGELGYLPPPPDNGIGGGAEYDIYLVKDPGHYLDSYGVVEWEVPIVSKPNGGTWTNFMEIHNDFTFVLPVQNRGLPAMRVTLTHELHHAIQVGNYGLWFGHEYFYEITSTWMEDVLYTEVNDYIQYLSANFRRPEEPFTNFELRYSRCIWGHFVAKRFGRDAMRRAWEEIQNVVPLQAMDNALRAAPYSSSFRQSFSEFALWNFFTGTKADATLYYPEGSFYPSMRQIPVGFTPPSRSVGGSVSPLAARYIQVLGTTDTLTLALSNINFDAGLNNPGTQFPFTYLLNVQQIDDSYRSTPVGIYFKLDVPDLTNWYTWDIVGRGVGSSTVAIGVPYPNPLIADGRSSLYLPVNSAVSIEGTLSVFTSSMDLVFASVLKSIAPQPNKQVFAWNGTTNTGEIVQTGVYVFVLEVSDQTITGKIAVVRK